MARPLVVVMGVAGSGKSTIGRAVATRTGLPFVDGDDHHSPDTKAQMSEGVALTEEQRVPWLDRLHEVLLAHLDRGIVLACSALTVASRKRLARDLDVRFVALLVPEDDLARRLTEREGHFVGPELLASQLATLELDDGMLHVDATRPIDEVVDEVVRVTGTADT